MENLNYVSNVAMNVHKFKSIIKKKVYDSKDKNMENVKERDESVKSGKVKN
jgi:hypothetical protein